MIEFHYGSESLGIQLVLEWNRHRTINVYKDGENIDCFTMGTHVPSIRYVLDWCDKKAEAILTDWINDMEEESANA